MEKSPHDPIKEKAQQLMEFETIKDMMSLWEEKIPESPRPNIQDH